MEASPEKLRSYAAQGHILDGRDVLIRAIRPDDKAAVQDAMHRLSHTSSYFRFFRPKPELSTSELAYFTEVDFAHHVALVAVVPEDGSSLLVGAGRYIVLKDQPGAAEVAFTVDDAHHGLGIATLLLRHLAGIAREAGLAEFRASVLSENKKMLDVFAHAGLPRRATFASGGVVEVALSLRDDATSAGNAEPGRAD